MSVIALSLNFPKLTNLPNLTAETIETLRPYDVATPSTVMPRSVATWASHLQMSNIALSLNFPKLTNLPNLTAETIKTITTLRHHPVMPRSVATWASHTLASKEIDLRSSLLRLGKVCKQSLPSA